MVDNKSVKKAQPSTKAVNKSSNAKKTDKKRQKSELAALQVFRDAYIEKKKGEIGAAWNDHPDYDKVVEILNGVVVNTINGKEELAPLQRQPNIQKVLKIVLLGGSFSGYDAEAAPRNVRRAYGTGPGATVIKRKREITAADGSANKAQKKSSEDGIEKVNHKKHSNIEGDEQGSHGGDNAFEEVEDGFDQEDGDLEVNEDQRCGVDLLSAENFQVKMDELNEAYALNEVVVAERRARRLNLMSEALELRVRGQLADHLGKIRDDLDEIKGHLKELIDKPHGKRS
ncbi:hypothetical protein SLS53_007396 [Cytospora paraplurivora]|uniref:Uncharacterized protein n=1 Tax=Cytospora paraplurivora TaxID=2898453 RepID=A0AAN9U3N2_9PEZI